MQWRDLMLLYLKIKKYSVYYSSYAYRKLISNTSSVIALDKDNKPLNYLLMRYILVKSLDSVVGFFDSIKYVFVFARNYCDIEANKIQICKNFDGNEKTVIIDSNLLESRDTVSLKDAIDFIEANGVTQTDNMTKNRVLKFDVHHEEKGSVCMRDYLIKYKDDEEKHHHTLNNIAVFNEIDVHPDSEVRIRYYKDRKLVEKVIPFNDIADDHIQKILMT